MPLHPAGTHLPMLLRAVMMTTGPVLELGCGDHSTLVLHEVCRHRRLVSLETDIVWFDVYKTLANKNHDIRFGNSYEDFDSLIREEQWDVVLIDHTSGRRRGVDLAKTHHARYVVIHDSEYFERGWYGFENEIPKFKYVYRCEKLYPFTTVVSETEPLNEFFKE